MNNLYSKLKTIGFIRGSKLTKSANALQKFLGLVGPHMQKGPLAKYLGGGTLGYSSGKAYDNMLIPGLEQDVLLKNRDLHLANEKQKDYMAALKKFQESLVGKEYKDSFFGSAGEGEAARTADNRHLRFLQDQVANQKHNIAKATRRLGAVKNQLSDRQNFTFSNAFDIVTGGALGRRFLNRKSLSGTGALKGPAIKLVTVPGARHLNEMGQGISNFINMNPQREINRAIDTAGAIGHQMQGVGNQLGETTNTVKKLLPYGAGVGGGLGGGIIGSLLADATSNTSVDSNLSEKEKEEARRKALRRKSLFALGGGALGGLAGYLGGGGRFGIPNKK